MDEARHALPLVLIPGLACSARVYAAQITALWPIASVTIASPCRDSDVVSAAARILSEAPPRFAVAGLSMGGHIAFEMVRQAPERVAKLALLDTTPRPDTPELIATRNAEIAEVEAGRLGEIVEVLIARFVSARRQGDEPLKTIVRQMAAETGAEAFVRQQRVLMSRPDSRPLLPSIRCPTLVLVGDTDTRTPPDIAREMATAIPGARLIVVPDCGHISTLERPDAVNDALREWLRAS